MSLLKFCTEVPNLSNNIQLCFSFPGRSQVLITVFVFKLCAQQINFSFAVCAGQPLSSNWERKKKRGGKKTSASCLCVVRNKKTSIKPWHKQFLFLFYLFIFLKASLKQFTRFIIHKKSDLKPTSAEKY